MSPLKTNSLEIKDERWVIKTFRPLLKSLQVQNIPQSPDFTVVYLADRREWIIQGMGRCIVVIERQNLPKEVGGLLITSHDTELDCFYLHILINSSFCKTTNFNGRVMQKLTSVHEFTHTVAALSAIARVRSKELIKRLKEIFRQKTHALLLTDIKEMVADLRRLKKTSKIQHFPDEHYRLGFEDFPVSYPIILEEFLLSKELFDEYFSTTDINKICKAIEKGVSHYNKLVKPLCQKISAEKALDISFVEVRVWGILKLPYFQYAIKKALETR